VDACPDCGKQFTREATRAEQDKAFGKALKELLTAT